MKHEKDNNKSVNFYGWRGRFSKYDIFKRTLRILKQSSFVKRSWKVNVIFVTQKNPSGMFYSGGVYVPQSLFVPLQSAGTASSASHGFPLLPPVAHHAFPLCRYIPPCHSPRLGGNGNANPNINGEGPPQLRKLFIGGLSHETTDEQLWQFYAQWGTVVDCIVIRDPQTKYSRGFGFVTFATVQMAEAAMADRPHTINQKVVDPKRAIPREQMSPLLPNHPPPFLEGEPKPGCKLSISGILWERHTVDTLRYYFDSFGVVEQVEILANPRGSGFVVFEEKCSADKCVTHGPTHTINGKKCEVTAFEECYIESEDSNVRSLDILLNSDNSSGYMGNTDSVFRLQFDETASMLSSHAGLFSSASDEKVKTYKVSNEKNEVIEITKNELSQKQEKRKSNKRTKN